MVPKNLSVCVVDSRYARRWLMSLVQLYVASHGESRVRALDFLRRLLMGESQWVLFGGRGEVVAFAVFFTGVSREAGSTGDIPFPEIPMPGGDLRVANIEYAVRAIPETALSLSVYERVIEAVAEIVQNLPVDEAWGWARRGSPLGQFFLKNGFGATDVALPRQFSGGGSVRTEILDYYRIERGRIFAP